MLQEPSSRISNTAHVCRNNMHSFHSSFGLP